MLKTNKSINVVYIANKVYSGQEIRNSLKSIENQSRKIDNIYIIDYCSNYFDFNDYEDQFLEKISIERKCNNNNIISDINKYVKGYEFNYYFFTSFDCVFGCDHFRILESYNCDLTLTDCYYIENNQKKYYSLSPIINFTCFSEDNDKEYFFLNNYIYYNNIQTFFNKLISRQAILSASEENSSFAFTYKIWQNSHKIKIDQHLLYFKNSYYYEKDAEYSRNLKIEEYLSNIVNIYQQKISEEKIRMNVLDSLTAWIMKNYNLPATFFTKNNLKSKIENFNFDDLNYYYSIKGSLSYHYDIYQMIKETIIDEKIEYVSFDIFDTLIKRKCLEPIDLFYNLDKKFNSHYKKNQYIYFSSIRIEAENQCRKNLINRKGIEEITIDEIYDFIKDNYKEIDASLVDELKEYEKELEIKYCICRNSAKELYDLANYIGKKIIIISDMYLDITTIKSILEKNGYNNIYKIFLSSETKKLKGSGKAFELVLNNLSITADKIMHIGDNYNSDVISPSRYEIKSFELKKISSMLYESNWYSNYINTKKASMFLVDDSLNFMGNKSLLALISNEIYDYPFLATENNEYYSSPRIIGQIPMFLSLFGISLRINKLKNQNNYDNLLFVSRDGYMLMRAYNEIFKKDTARTDYLYCSRKVFLPLSIKDKLDYYSLIYSRQNIPLSPEKFYKYFKDHIEISESEYKRKILKSGYSYVNNFNNERETKEFLDYYLKHFYNEIKHLENRKAAKNYFKKFFGENSCLIDVGYSGRGETILSILLEKKINSIYIHSKDRIPYNRSEKIGFNIDTILPTMPKISGSIREQLFSKCDGSCVHIDFEKEEIQKGKLTAYYPEEWTIKCAQESSIEMIRTYMQEYKSNLCELDYKPYELNLILEKFYYFPYDEDAKVFRSIYFEDDINIAKRIVNLYDIWTQFIGQYYKIKPQHIDIPAETPAPVQKRSLFKSAIVKLCRPLYRKSMIRLSKVVEEAVVNAMQDNTNNISDIKNNIKK